MPDQVLAATSLPVEEDYCAREPGADRHPGAGAGTITGAMGLGQDEEPVILRVSLISHS